MTGKTRKKRSTETTSFGAPGRFNHDASRFYASRMYAEMAVSSQLDPHDNCLPETCENHIFCKSSTEMDELPDASVHLMVTSPPYNAAKDYDEDLTLDEYREFLRRVWKEVMRVLVAGGRACINIANLGRKPYLPLHAFVIQDMLDLGFLMRGEVIWNKAASSSSSTAWGSWRSARNPTLRDVHEYILVFSKGGFSRGSSTSPNTISRDEFLEYTRSVWNFPTETARKIGHPAPFPVELPYRLIQLYTFKGEVVLDPFMGSGQTAVAACSAGRSYTGYEINPEYVQLAEKRIAACVSKDHPQSASTQD